MGYNVNEGYYEKHVNKEGYKITDEQEKFNALDMSDVREGIGIAEQQYAKDHGIELPKSQSNKKEPIEYVVEEQQDKEMEL
ncbi:MAG: hypothetical protein J6A04_04985 [Clostridia bacterium]|nr:hypothetical protein [Clostridia bacterium]